MTKLQTPAAVILIAGLCAGCASGPSSGRASTPQPSPQADFTPPQGARRSELITRDEWAQTRYANMAEVVRQLRPEYFRLTMIPRSDGPGRAYAVVYVNGVFAGASSALQMLAPDAVDEVRFVPAAQAKVWWGSGCQCDGGVIHVQTR